MSKHTSTVFKILGALGINAAMVYGGISEYRRNHEWYKQLPEEKQKELYNNCSEQKVTNDGGVISGLYHNRYMANPEIIKDTQLKKPYQPTTPKKP